MPVVPLGMTMVPTYLGPGGATAANVLAFVNIGGDFDSTTLDGILGSWQAYWTTLTNENWTIDSTAVCTDLRTDPPPIIVAGNTGDNGDGGGDALPAQTSFVVSLRAGGGRSKRGRVYIAGIGEGDVGDDSRVSGAYATLAIDGFVDHATYVGGTFGWVPAVYSRKNSSVALVSSVGADTVIDTQRRRVERLA